jgi:hypothetical protein
MSSAIRKTEPNGKNEPQKPKLKTFHKQQLWYRYTCTWPQPMIFRGKLPKHLTEKPKRIPRGRCDQQIEHFSQGVVNHLFEGHWNRHIKERDLLLELRNNGI